MITEISEAVTALLHGLQPSIDEHFSQKYLEEHQGRLRDLETILAIPDNESRALRLSEFMAGLFLASGIARGSLSDSSIEIPVSDFLAIVTTISAGIMHSQQLGKLSFKQSGGN